MKNRLSIKLFQKNILAEEKYDELEKYFIFLKVSRKSFAFLAERGALITLMIINLSPRLCADLLMWGEHL